MQSLLAVLAGFTLAVLGGPGPGQYQTNVITDIQEVFNAANQAALQGRRVEWSNVQVQQVLNSEVLMVGTKDHQVLVRRQQIQPVLRPGQKIDLTGVLDQMPATTQGADTPGKDQQLLKGHSVFLNAYTLKLHEPANRGS